MALSIQMRTLMGKKTLLGLPLPSKGHIVPKELTAKQVCNYLGIMGCDWGTKELELIFRLSALEAEAGPLPDFLVTHDQQGQ